jgi:acetolactate synthase I/II/III large subunit
MSTTEPVTGAEFLARSLAANGTTHVFFIDAVLRRTLIELGTLGVHRVLGHSEKAVAYMADGYARIAGRPGICFAQSVGAANLASGLQDAYLGFAPVTKFSARVDQAADLPRLMRQAWREAMTGTPRPAHLDLNGLQADVIETGMVADSPVAEPAFQLTLPPHRPVASSAEIERAAERILQAKKVVIVAGEGATASGAGKELLALGTLLAAPIATSLGGRGLIPTRHRLSVGCAGNYAAPPTNRIVHAAELVVFVGCETGDQVTHTWRIPAIDTPCVQIDLDPTDIGRSYPNTLGVMGDPKATLAALIMALGKPARDSEFADWAAGIVSAWRQGRAAALRSEASPIWPDRLCDEITRALPADGILVADTGYSGIWSSTLIELNGEGQTYLRAAGSLGWA